MKDLQSSVPVTYCICEADGGGFVHCLAILHEYVLEHRPKLYERTDKGGNPSIGVFLAADQDIRFTDVRSASRVRFARFVLP